MLELFYRGGDWLEDHKREVFMIFIAAILPQMGWFFVAAIESSKWISGWNVFLNPAKPLLALIWGAQSGTLFLAIWLLAHFDRRQYWFRGFLNVIVGAIVAMVLPTLVFFFLDLLHEIGTIPYQTHASFTHQWGFYQSYYLRSFSYLTSFFLVGVAAIIVGWLLRPLEFRQHLRSQSTSGSTDQPASDVPLVATNLDNSSAGDRIRGQVA